MSTEPKRVHGSPSWLQHSSQDPVAARRFYESVLGWTVSEIRMSDGADYPAIIVDGRPVGGFSPVPGGDGWLTYIAVDDVDGCLSKAIHGGATVASAPMTVPGVGRVATLDDPFGAKLALIDYSKA